MAPVVGLCALLAADAVLIVWAFRGTPVDDPGPAASVRALTSSAAPSSPSPSSASPSSATPSASASAPKVAPVEQSIAVVGPSVAWVARAGSCKEPGTVWVTDDAGSSWTSQDAPGRVMRARPSSARGGFVTGGDAECELRLWTTGNAGRAWGEPTSAAEAWSRVPDDAKAVHTPDDAVSRPCGSRRVLDLAALTAQRAIVVCDNGDVRSTSNRGEDWPKAFTLAGALAIGAVEGGSGVVLRSVASCRGVVAVPLVGGEPEGDGRCVPGSAEAGEVAVSGVADSWWVVVGDRVHRAEQPGGPWDPTGSPLDG